MNVGIDNQRLERKKKSSPKLKFPKKVMEFLGIRMDDNSEDTEEPTVVDIVPHDTTKSTFPLYPYDPDTEDYLSTEPRHFPELKRRKLGSYTELKRGELDTVTSRIKSGIIQRIYEAEPYKPAQMLPNGHISIGDFNPEGVYRSVKLIQSPADDDTTSLYVDSMGIEKNGGSSIVSVEFRNPKKPEKSPMTLDRLRSLLSDEQSYLVNISCTTTTRVERLKMTTNHIRVDFGGRMISSLTVKKIFDSGSNFDFPTGHEAIVASLEEVLHCLEAPSTQQDQEN